MNQPAPGRTSKTSSARWFWTIVALAALGYFGFIALQVERTAGVQEVHSAQAIVVFGAAEYSGHPSPVFRARLDHAYTLFQQGRAPVVITTGGAGADPSFNEGEVGHDYLMHRGIPEANLIAETQGSDTAQSAARVAVIMRTNHMNTCLAVSDAYHVFRIGRLLEHEGITAYLAPRPDSRPHSAFQQAEAIARETLSYILWRMHVTR